MKEEKYLTVRKKIAYKEAICCYKESIRLQTKKGEYMKPYYNLINVYCKLKEYLKAIDVFEEMKEYIKEEEGNKYNIYSNIKKAYQYVKKNNISEDENFDKIRWIIRN